MAPSRPTPRSLTRVLQLAVSAGLLAALILLVDWDTVWQAADELSAITLALLIAVCLAAQAMLVLRWRALLGMLGVRESWARAWHSVFAGLFLSNFLPGSLGSDGLRVVLLTNSCGRASTAIGAVAYERLMQLVIYLCLVTIAALASVPWMVPWVRVAIVAAGALAIGLVPLILYWLGKRSSQAPAHRSTFLNTAFLFFVTILAETGRMQARMRRHRRSAVAFWAASACNVGLIVAIWWIVLVALSHDVGIATIAFVAGSAGIAGAVPVSLNGLGVFEATAVTLLALAGVPPSHGLLLALIIRAVFLASSFFGIPSACLLWHERGVKQQADCGAIQ